MPEKRRAIRLFEHEDLLMKEIYLRYRIPIDQYERRQKQLQVLTAEWNARSRRTDSIDDVIHYMKTKRKQKLWVTFDGNYLAQPALDDDLTDLEIEVLKLLYVDLIAANGLGSDVLVYNKELEQKLASEFEVQTNRSVQPHVLTAKLTELRKRGFLPTVTDTKSPVSNKDLGFADMDDVTNNAPPKDTRS